MSTQIEISFVDEPPTAEPAGRRSHWTPVAEQLRGRPGEWALLGRHNRTMVSNITKGILRPFAGGDFEARAADVDDNNKADIYARFVGESNEDDDYEDDDYEDED